jgi:hypothetical protein
VTGLVQEFEFGMSWSAYSRFAGDVFGAPLAMESLAAFVLRADRHDRGHRGAAARRLHLQGWAFVVFRHRLAVPNTAPPSARPDERKRDVHGRR